MPLWIGGKPEEPPERIKDYGHWYIREDLVRETKE
jgi:hypothetical protein